VSDLASPLRESVPINDYIRGNFVPISHLAFGWELHTAVPLTPSEERTMVREPAQAVPGSIADRLGKLRVLVVPFIECKESGDCVAFSKPAGETHSVVWIEEEARIHVILACRELDPHDTGFEFLAGIAELLRARLSPEELQRYTDLLEAEMRREVHGEIDEEALAAKRSLLERRRWRRQTPELFERYRDTSLVSTLAEYFHGLWHDVQIRVGPEHLPVAELRHRMKLFAELFPPNAGYQVFAKELENGEL
jgi:hypothetical protein